MSRAPTLRLLLVPAAIAWGVSAEIVATHAGQSTTYAGASGWMVALDLAAGWGLVAAGLALWQLRPGVTGPLAVAAGFAWFAPDWIGWDGGPALVRSLGMLAAGIWLAFLVHAVLAFPHGLRSVASRVLVLSVYAETVVVAIGLSLFRNPFDDPNCWSNCTDNSFLVRSDPGIARSLTWLDLGFAIVLAVSFAVLAAWRLAAAAGPARRALAPVLAGGIAVTTVHALSAVALLRTPLEDSHAASFEALFVAGCLATGSVALALGWTLLRARRARETVERLTVELDGVPQPGTLQSALVRATGDSSLRIAYRLRSSERYVDGDGHPARAPSSVGDRAVTAIVRDGLPVALVEHDPAVLDQAFVSRIGSAARLAVENERLQAETLARLIELRDSRSRIVQAGDEVRRRLERDLHDGAQQRLVALSFALRLARAELGPEPDPRVTKPLADAERRLTAALAAVRAVANGLFPATLASSGLGHAVEELAELAPIRIDVDAVPDRRFSEAVEAAAYGVIREAVENAVLHADASMVSIRAVCRSNTVVVETADDGIGGADPERGVGLRDIADRVGALGGRLRITSPSDGGTRIQAEIPCA
jgi:signal transduction histidine kinase